MISRLTRVALLAAVAAVLMLGGCALGGTSIRDRISEFIADVNASDYSNLYKHLHTDCSQRNALKDPTKWGPTAFGPTEIAVSLSGMSYGDTSIGKFSSKSLTDADITFVMKEEDKDDWYILSITVDGLAPIE